jgi:DNA-binding FadR family transcriptional regulator
MDQVHQPEITPCGGASAGAPDKEACVLGGLVDMIGDPAWGLGARLPPERRLAEMFGTSRNTVRGALRVLEARGMVDIRKGSGCYLRARTPQRGPEPGPPAGLEEWPGRLEACYLVLPGIAELAARRADAADLAQVEAHTVALSQAIFSLDQDSLVREHAAYLAAIAACAKNPSLVQISEALCVRSSSIFRFFYTLADADREEVFSGCVRVFNALKQRDPEAARRCMQARILHVCRLLARYAGVAFEAFLAEAMARDGGRP